MNLNSAAILKQGASSLGVLSRRLSPSPETTLLPSGSLIPCPWQHLFIATLSRRNNQCTVSLPDNLVLLGRPHSGGEEEKGVVTNGLDVSPVDEKKGGDKSEEKVVVTKMVEKITSEGGDGATKYITKSVTVTQKVEEHEETFEEKLVSTKKVEKVTSHAIVKEVTQSD